MIAPGSEKLPEASLGVLESSQWHPCDGFSHDLEGRSRRGELGYGIVIGLGEFAHDV